MLTKSDFTEKEFQDFMKAGFGDVGRLHPQQVKEMRRAFYGGLATALFNPEKLKEINQECKHFFENEVKEYKKDLLK